MRSRLVLFTPGPVQIPQMVAEYLADPPCNYHRQEGFRAMYRATQADLKSLLGIREPEAWTATLLTTTGTGANEACLLALSGAGRGLIVENGFFGARLVAQATACGVEHTRLVLPDDRPIDPAAVDAALKADPDLAWLYFVSHETRMGLANPTTQIGRTAARHGVLVAADVVSHAFAYPLDLEAARLDLAVTSSAKALMAAPGLGIVFARLATLPRLRGSTRSHYFDLLAELDFQRQQHQPRFAQPVALHAALYAACKHLRCLGIDAHMRRIRSQMDELVQHLEGLGIAAQLDPAHRSWVALNFRLPASLPYQSFAQQMEAEGYYVLYGVPGDSGHFQLSTLGDLEPHHVAGLKAALGRILHNARTAKPRLPATTGA